MSTDHPDVPWLPREHDENRRTFPPENLIPYMGEFVAWSWEGDRIVGHDATREGLWQQLLDAGINPQRVVFEYIDDL